MINENVSRKDEGKTKKSLHATVQIIPGFFAFLFVLTTLLAVVLVTLGSRLFNPNLYKNALLDQQAYEKLPEIIGEMLVSSTTYDPCSENPITCESMPPELAACYLRELGDERFTLLTGGKAEPVPIEQELIQACYEQFGSRKDETTSAIEMPFFLKDLGAEDWAAVIQRILPPGQLQSMVEPLLDDTFAYLEGDVDRVSLSLVTLKERLAESTGDEWLLMLITSQPDCTDMLLGLITGELTMDELRLCNPPEILLPFFISTTRTVLDEAVATIPNEVVILPPKDRAVTGEETSSADPGQVFRQARLVMFLSPLVPLAFLGLVTLFGVRSLKGWLRWWGIPFSLAGGLVVVGSLALLFFWQPAWERWVMPRFPVYLGEGFSGLVHGLAWYLLRDLAMWMGLAGLLLLLVGLILWVLARIGKRVGAEERPTGPPESKVDEL